EECCFIEREAKENRMTEEDLIGLVMGLFFITGYKTMFGKE
ncbi:unnamed protein product, partial [marine sediment metagenome]